VRRDKELKTYEILYFNDKSIFTQAVQKSNKTYVAVLNSGIFLNSEACLIGK